MPAKPERELSPAFSASRSTLNVLLTSKPPLITDTHCQARGGAAHRFGGPGLMLGIPHHRKAEGSRYAPSFDRLDIGVSFFDFDIRRQVFGKQSQPARQ